MPSAFIRAVLSYPAVPLARQLAHQRYVPPNPLVLGRKLLKSPTPTTDRDRPISRRSKPTSRTAFIGGATAFPSSTAGALSPAFAPARLIGLAVKHPSPFTLVARLPTGLRVS